MKQKMKNLHRMMKMANKNKEHGSFFTKNQSLTVQCVDMSYQGFGVAKIDDFVIFTKGLLLNEKASIRLVKVFKTYAFAIIDEIIEASKYRVNPKCSVYKQCGGCDLMHADYDEQLSFKQHVVQQQLTYHNIDFKDVLPTLSNGNIWGYRNKVACPVLTEEMNTAIGFYRQNSHDIVEFDVCHVQSELQNKVVSSIKEFLKVKPIHVLKHVVMRQVGNPNQLMLGLVSTSETHENYEALINHVTNQIPEVKSIVLNINKRDTNTIFGKKDILLYGKDYLMDYSLGLSFKISLRSFFQVNSEMMKILYNEAIQAADIKANETVLDLYCGIGTLSLLASKHALHVYGVESNLKAIEDAQENAINNKITNVTFKHGDVKDILEYFKKENITCDTVIVDPPRAGLQQEVLSSLLELEAYKIVYVSCNPVSLAKNLNVLSDKYSIEYVQPVDLFPQTRHVETVVLLTKVETLNN